MYPLKSSDTPFLHNEWYVAALRTEVGDKILARTILEEPVILYRTDAGKVVALWGICPHRLAPLDLGTRKGDAVVCGYHGFTFSPSGECIDIPISEIKSTRCRLKSYPVVERGPWVWIWMGDPEAPDDSKLPDASDIGLGDNPEGWRVDLTTTMDLKARSQLLIDNLFDLSHLAFVHANSVQPGTADLALVRPFMGNVSGKFRVGRELSGVPFLPGTLVDFLFPNTPGKADLLLHTDFYNICLLNAAGPWVYRHNDDSSRGECMGKLNFVHVVTPETRHTTHYFAATTRNFRLDDEEFSDYFIDRNNVVRREDCVMLEAIEARSAKYGDPKKEVSVPSDAGALRIRRMIQEKLNEESGEFSKNINHAG